MKKRKASSTRQAKAAAPPESGPASPRRYHSRAVAKALEIIETLKQNPNPVSLHELSREVRLTKASLLRILDTLVEDGYLKKAASGVYSATPDLSFALPAGGISRLLRVAVPELKELTRRFNESTALGHLFTNHIEVISVCEGRQIVRMGNTVGRIIQPHASALGKVIAAFQKEDRCERLLHSYGLLPITPRTITDESELREELRRIREQGYAIDDEETTLGGQCFGAPIIAPRKEVLAAVSMSVPKMRVGPAKHQEKILTAVKETASKISEALASTA